MIHNISFGCSVTLAHSTNNLVRCTYHGSQGARRVDASVFTLTNLLLTCVNYYFFVRVGFFVFAQEMGIHSFSTCLATFQ